MWIYVKRKRGINVKRKEGNVKNVINNMQVQVNDKYVKICKE